jgi:2'-5' RNA ligase
MDVEKYFLAIIIPEPFHSEIWKMKELVAQNFKSKGALRSPAHITLHLPFRWKKDKEAELIEKLNEFTFGKPVNIKLKDFADFEPRVLYVAVEPNELLNELQKGVIKFVKENLNLFNEVGNRRGFHPHVTIAFRDLKKEQFRLAKEYFKDQTFEAEFTATQFCLLKYGPGKWEVYKEFSFTG